MARTDATNVGKVIEVDDTIDLTVFIDSASELVTELCTGTNGPDPAYTDTRLELIERWLAAHFYAIRDTRPANEKAGSVGVAYQYKVGLNLANTMFGQQAMAMDTNGGLANLNKATEEGKLRKPGMFWLGTESA